MDVVIGWLIFLAVGLVALAGTGVAARRAPWLNDPSPQHRVDPEARGFFE